MVYTVYMCDVFNQSGDLLWLNAYKNIIRIFYDTTECIESLLHISKLVFKKDCFLLYFEPENLACASRHHLTSLFEYCHLCFILGITCNTILHLYFTLMTLYIVNINCIYIDVIVVNVRLSNKRLKVDDYNNV